MKRTEPEFPGQRVYQDGPESLDRAIRRLEWWHRMWEINNRDRITHPSFASEHEVTHEHDWTRTVPSPISGALWDECDLCPAKRPHVDGTPGVILKGETRMRDAMARMYEI